MSELKPTRNEYTNYGLGTALAAVFVWAVGAFTEVVIPAEIGVFVGSIFVWAAWKLGLGNN